MTKETTASEADLEARIAATLRRVFPGHLNLQHQTRFRVRLGHKEFDAGKRDYVDGRADILVRDGENPLAVLELKREGLPLTSDDEAQGWSYAALARAPLVVLTNGADTRIFLTHDRSPMVETSLGAEELANRLKTAAELAQVAVNGAIDRLLGSDLAPAAVDAINAFELRDQSGSWSGAEAFVEEFLVPRSATMSIRARLRKPKPRVIVVTGAPLSGKSSVLRELVTTCEAYCVTAIYIDGSACNEGLFRRVANVLANIFSWPATEEDARRWIKRLASDPDRPLVLCIDSPETNNVLRAEFDEILTGNLGDLRLVIALDESQLDSWLLKSHRRDCNRLGRHTEVIRVEQFDDAEFEAASRHLEALGGLFVHGAAYAPELRSPWILRAAVAPRMEDLPANKSVVLPPMLGLETLEIAEARFAQLEELGDGLVRLARIYLEQTDAEKPDEQKLVGLYDYCISREWLKARMDASEIYDMTQAGLLQAKTDVDAGALYYVRAPALFAKLLASRLHALTMRMAEKGKSEDECAQWLVSRCSRLPLGDLIGADVVRQCALDTRKLFGLRLVNSLLAYRQ